MMTHLACRLLIIRGMHPTVISVLHELISVLQVVNLMTILQEAACFHILFLTIIIFMMRSMQDPL